MARMLDISEVLTEAQGRIWWKQQWRRTEFIAERIEDLQMNILQVLVWNPSGVALVPGYCLENDSFPALQLFRRMRHGYTTPFNLLRSMCDSPTVTESELMLLWDMWRCTYYQGAAGLLWKRHLITAVDRLKKIYAWQYRQEKARRKAA